MPRLSALLDFLESLAPLRLAAEWDNVGLLFGQRDMVVDRMMTCLSLTPESAQEAVDQSANLVVSHHPVMFRPVNKLTDDTPEGRMLLLLARHSVAIYSSHTAYDDAVDGINDQLAMALGLKQVGPLRRRSDVRQYKVVVFVPDSDVGKVADAMFAAGAGNIGNYSQCSFRLPGTGTFFGSEVSNPTVGTKGRREEVSEWRLEAVCPAHRLHEVIASMRKAHTYEEPAYDIYPLDAPPPLDGQGRLGKLEPPVSLGQLARKVKASLKACQVQIVGDLEKNVSNVAIMSGAGGEFLAEASRAGAEVFLTGELKFHDFLAARARGISLVLPGHYATERFAMELLAEKVSRQFPELSVWASECEADPVVWI